MEAALHLPLIQTVLRITTATNDSENLGHYRNFKGIAADWLQARLGVATRGLPHKGTGRGPRMWQRGPFPSQSNLRQHLRDCGRDELQREPSYYSNPNGREYKTRDQSDKRSILTGTLHIRHQNRARRETGVRSRRCGLRRLRQCQAREKSA